MTTPQPADETPILDDLAKVGIETGSLAELRQSGLRYREAIPVLVDWLKKTDDPKLLEEIVRALTVPWAKPLATEPMIKRFRDIPDHVDPDGFGIRWTIGNALDVIADDTNYDDLVGLATNPHYKKARQMVVLGLGKSKRPEVIDVLLSLLNDPDVDGHATDSLAKLKNPAARAGLESKLNDHRAWVRRTARKGLAKLP